jgi:predicted nuclease of predicted toxin-antitoxin system
MKLLLDECAPQRLKNDFPGHEIWTVEDVGLKGLKDGELLRAAAEQVDVLITVDQRMQFQQNLLAFNLAVVVLIANPCRYAQLTLLTPKILDCLETIKAGEIVIIQ